MRARQTTAPGSSEAPSDTQLVHSFCAGETDAFAQIVRRHHERLTWVARRYARREDDVQDILQEAYLRAAQHMDGFRAEAKLTTWLHRLVANSARDHDGLVRHRRETPVLDAPGTRRFGSELTHDPMHSADLRVVLARALGALHPGQAAALVLTDALGHSVAGTARILGVRPGTVKSRAARGRRRLREVIDPHLARDDSSSARPGLLVA